VVVETRNILFFLEFIIITIVVAPEFIILGCWVSSHHHVVCSSPKIWSKTWPVNLFIFSEENRPVLDWPTRIKVAAGAARGIAYLHEDCKYLLFRSILTQVYIYHQLKTRCFHGTTCSFGAWSIYFKIRTPSSLEILQPLLRCWHQTWLHYYWLHIHNYLRVFPFIFRIFVP